MATGPFQSKLDPYLDLIAELRAAHPPATYARIAEILKDQHQVTAHRATIQHFVKVRATRRVIRLVHRDENISKSDGKRGMSGKVPADIQERLKKLKEQPIPPPQERLSFLPPDGRLTFRGKS